MVVLCRTDELSDASPDRAYATRIPSRQENKADESGCNGKHEKTRVCARASVQEKAEK